MKISQLLKRTESTVKPDRGLDAALAVYFRLHPYGPEHWLNQSPDVIFYPLDSEGSVAIQDEGDTTPRDAWASPQFTYSIDATRDLIKRTLPSHQIEMGEYTDADDFSAGCFARVSRYAGGDGPRFESDRASGATLELALLGAFLRALIAEEVSP